MTIVDDDKVSVALDYLACNPHPVAVARKALADAENRRKRVFAETYRSFNEGTVKDREVRAETSEAYQVALLEENEAAFEFENERARVKNAETVIEVWRSENANARAAERVR